MNPRLLSTSAFALLFSLCIQAQSLGEYEIGVSYRYISYNEASLSLTLIHGEYLNPHELDLNFRFDIGDPNIRGTLVLGWARYEQTDFTYSNPLIGDCNTPQTINAVVQDQHAYRFNPGIEYGITRGKLSYGFGVGLFYYGTFRGNQVETYTTIYTHRDSLTNECEEDSVRLQVVTNRAPSKVAALIGLSGHLFAGYEPVNGITFFAAFTVNPVFSTTNHYFALAPSGSAGVYFRFNRRDLKTPASS